MSMETAKHKIIYFFFTHIFLRRIGKRYPDFFASWIADYVENLRDRKILIMRYTGTPRMTFTDIAKAESAISKACYYDSVNGASSDKTY